MGREDANIPAGPGWLPPPPEDSRSPAPKWQGAHAFPAVWRDSLAMGAGIFAAMSEPQWAHLRLLSTGWDTNPDSENNADVDQAIGAKIHLATRTVPILAEAQVVKVELDDVLLAPRFEEPEATLRYARHARLPASPVFFDFEAHDGEPVSWRAETWPLPFHLRGALCWHYEGVMSVVPYGSVGGANPFGGTDYQAWARWVFPQDEADSRWSPGPGDFIASPDGSVTGWVTLTGESVCAHHGAIAFNLAEGALAVLRLLEATGAELAAPHMTRPERRRAQRAGMKIPLMPTGLPRFSSGGDPEDDLAESGHEQCPIAGAHRRLNEVHVLWHDALCAYSDPDVFVSRLNALLQTFRSITLVLQKELDKDFKRKWYPAWQGRMKADPKLRWSLEARNQVAHVSDLSGHSTARVRIRGTHIAGDATEISVSPWESAADIARRINVHPKNERVRREGTLLVERRWVADDWPDDEVLDVLAYCFGEMVTLIADAHTQLGVHMEKCEMSRDTICTPDLPSTPPAGRPSCMRANKEERTSRRDLMSGAPTGVAIRNVVRPGVSREEMERRYGPAPWVSIPDGADLFEYGRALHGYARRFFLADGEHVMIAWLLRDAEPLAQQALWPTDQRSKYLMMERLASEAVRLDANEVIITGEGWDAPLLPADDPGAELAVEDRDDRQEVLLTHALRKDEGGTCWRSAIVREGERVGLGDVQEVREVPVLFLPFLEAWADDDA